MCHLLPFILSGCGAVVSIGKGTGTLVALPGALNFDSLHVGDTVTADVSLVNRSAWPAKISSLGISGRFFSIKNQVSLPMSLPAGGADRITVQFSPNNAGEASGELRIIGDVQSGATLVIPLSGTAMMRDAAVSSLSCNRAVVTGSGTDTCTVTLNGEAPEGGISVALFSSNAAVTLPTAVTVTHNSAATFNATIAEVTAGQSTTLTAKADGSSASFTLHMNPAASAPVALLTVNSPTAAFGNVALSTQATQSLTLTSAGTIPVTLNAITVSGSGFAASGLTLPATLPPGESATLNVQFDPRSTGAANGTLVIASNSVGGGRATILLSGTGISPGVQLSWDAPAASNDPIVGYNIYRSIEGSSQYQRLNQSVEGHTAFVDNTVQSGHTYDYYVTSVDHSGVESTPSDAASVMVPSLTGESLDVQRRTLVRRQ